MLSIKTGESWLGAANPCSGAGWAPHSGWGTTVMCIPCFSCLWFLPLFLLSPFSLLLILSLYFNLFQLLNCSYINTWVLLLFSPNTPPRPSVGEEWGSCCVVLSCHLELNHDIKKYTIPWQEAWAGLAVTGHWNYFLAIYPIKTNTSLRRKCAEKLPRTRSLYLPVAKAELGTTLPSVPTA